MEQTFYKYHGAGNDFILMDARGSGTKFTREEIARLCDRRFAIGADGFMALEDDPEGTDFYMRYYNADGGEVAMCGNGGRCIALFAHHLGIGGAVKTFNSMDGLHTAELLSTVGNAGRIRLQMVDVSGYETMGNALFLNTGVPHYVEFVDDVAQVDVHGRGRAIRNAETFASRGGTNVNFVQVLPGDRIRIRTYERGVEGETYACGTGAVASAIATGIVCNPSQHEFDVEVVGGELKISFEKAGENAYIQVFLEGPAVKVFQCDLNLDEIFAQ